MATAINNFMSMDGDNHISDENGGDTVNFGADTQFANRGGESPSFYTPHPNRTGTSKAPQQNYQVFYSFMQNQLIESVKASLNNELFSNATFLCERLHAQVQNEDVRHLLAQCYLGKYDHLLEDLNLSYFLQARAKPSKLMKF